MLLTKITDLTREASEVRPRSTASPQHRRSGSVGLCGVWCVVCGVVCGVLLGSGRGTTTCLRFCRGEGGRRSKEYVDETSAS